VKVAAKLVPEGVAHGAGVVQLVGQVYEQAVAQRPGRRGRRAGWRAPPPRRGPPGYALASLGAALLAALAPLREWSEAWARRSRPY
jgi:hypothetical protein